MIYKYFNQSDFDICNPKCTIDQMYEKMMRKLDSARELAGIPFVLTSAFRSVAHDKAKGRSGNSSHTRGLAVDVAAITGHQKFKIVEAALRVGFTRIGIHAKFIHLDIDDSLPNPTIWLY